jgi:hypothetical protein
MELIDEPDAVEVIRDQVAAILSLELKNQACIAFDWNVPDRRDYDVVVYLENARPYETNERLKSFVNVLLSRVTVPETNVRAGRQMERLTLWLDCAAFGNDAAVLDDKSAAMRAWKTARIVRRILMSDVYLYLGLCGTVGSRFITTMEAGTPANTDDSAFAIAVVRLTLSVSFSEKAIQAGGEPLEPIDFEIDPDTGEVSANAGT